MSNKKVVNRKFLEDLVAAALKGDKKPLFERDFTQVGGTFGIGGEPLFQDALQAAKKGDRERVKASMQGLKDLAYGQGAIAAAILSYAALAAGGMAVSGKAAAQPWLAGLETPLGKALVTTAVTYYSQKPEYWQAVWDLVVGYSKTFRTQVVRRWHGGREKQSINSIQFGELGGEHERLIKSFYSIYSKEDYRRLNCDLESNPRDCRKKTYLPSCYTHRVISDQLSTLFKGRALVDAFRADYQKNIRKQIEDYKKKPSGISGSKFKEINYTPVSGDYINLYNSLKDSMNSFPVSGPSNETREASDVIPPFIAKRMAVLAEKLNSKLGQGGTVVSWDVFALLCLTLVYDKIGHLDQGSRFPSSNEAALGRAVRFLNDRFGLGGSMLSAEDEEDMKQLTRERSDDVALPSPIAADEEETTMKTYHPLSTIDVLSFFEDFKIALMRNSLKDPGFWKAFTMFFTLVKVDSGGEFISMDEADECLNSFQAMKAASSPEQFQKKLASSDKESQHSWGQQFFAFMAFTSPEAWAIDAGIVLTGNAVRTAAATLVGGAEGEALKNVMKSKSWVGTILATSVLMACYFLDPLNKNQRKKIIDLIQNTKAQLESWKSKAEKGEKFTLSPEKSSNIMNNYYKALEEICEELEENVDQTWAKTSNEHVNKCETLKSRMKIVEKISETNRSLKKVLGSLGASELLIDSDNISKVYGALIESEKSVLHAFDSFKTADTTFMINEEVKKDMNTKNMFETYFDRNNKQVEIINKNNKRKLITENSKAIINTRLQLLPGGAKFTESEARAVVDAVLTLLSDSGVSFDHEMIPIYLQNMKKFSTGQPNNLEEFVYSLKENFKSRNSNNFMLSDEHTSARTSDNLHGIFYKRNHEGLKLGRADGEIYAIPAAAGIDGLNSTSNAWCSFFVDTLIPRSAPRFANIYESATGIKDLMSSGPGNYSFLHVLGSKKDDPVARLARYPSQAVKVEIFPPGGSFIGKISQKLGFLDQGPVAYPKLIKFVENKLLGVPGSASPFSNASANAEADQVIGIASAPPEVDETTKDFLNLALLTFKIGLKMSIHKKRLDAAMAKMSTAAAAGGLSRKEGERIIKKYYRTGTEQVTRKKAGAIAQAVIQANQGRLNNLGALMGAVVYEVDNILKIDQELYNSVQK